MARSVGIDSHWDPSIDKTKSLVQSLMFQGTTWSFNMGSMRPASLSRARGNEGGLARVLANERGRDSLICWRAIQSSGKQLSCCQVPVCCISHIEVLPVELMRPRSCRMLRILSGRWDSQLHTAVVAYFISLVIQDPRLFPEV